MCVRYLCVNYFILNNSLRLSLLPKELFLVPGSEDHSHDWRDITIVNYLLTVRSYELSGEVTSLLNNATSNQQLQNKRFRESYIYENLKISFCAKENLL